MSGNGRIFFYRKWTSLIIVTFLQYMMAIQLFFFTGRLLQSIYGGATQVYSQQRSAGTKQNIIIPAFDSFKIELLHHTINFNSFRVFNPGFLRKFFFKFDDILIINI